MASTSKRTIIDSHVHLWPVETANLDGHTWMPPGMPIAKAHLPPDYMAATEMSESDDLDVEVQGLVFIESDVRYDIPVGDISMWARGPLGEMTFVRKIVQGEYGDRASKSMVGIVPWAPMDQPTTVLKEYLDLAKDKAGENTWNRVKGFRYLLQAITDEGNFKALVFSSEFIANLRLLGRRGFSFDVGVDQRSGGSWQLETMAQAMAMAHESVEEHDKVIFIVNHLCKPDFSDTGNAFDRWCGAISSMSKLTKTYMKLSGAFSELPVDAAKSTPSKIALRMKPWVAHIFETFGPKRVMFGSDWPVCNLKGPGHGDSWGVWNNVVEAIIEGCGFGLTQSDVDFMWSEAANEAYRLM